jgi:AcrR family transcriptional regulator
MDTETEGLRARKKRRTRQAISDAAIALILDRGFDKVSVADIAAAAEISKPTLFAYFPTKEDLVLDRIDDHRDEAARVVAQRGDQPPLAALHAHHRALLDARDPVTGLCDEPDSVRLREIIYGTPSLAAHLLRYAARSERALADALVRTAGVDEVTAAIAAAAINAVQLTLAERNHRAVVAGTSADDRYPAAVHAADRAFALLGAGLADELAAPAGTEPA